MSKQQTTVKNLVMDGDAPRGQRKIRELKTNQPLPMGADWFAAEKHYAITPDPEMGGYTITNQRGEAWWVPTNAVAYIVFE